MASTTCQRQLLIDTTPGSILFELWLVMCLSSLDQYDTFLAVKANGRYQGRDPYCQSYTGSNPYFNPIQRLTARHLIDEE
jgi:hypothetical protein